MPRMLCPSIYSVNFDRLEDSVLALEATSSDIFHVDFMDGNYVQNYALSFQDLETVRRHTRKLVDVHLMIENPGRYVETFAEKGADIIYIHPDSERHAARTLQRIRDLGRRAGIAVNPGISLSSLEEFWPMVDYVMMMGVNPGFGGQKFIDAMETKIQRVCAIRVDYDFKVFLDGGLNFDSIPRLVKLDLDGFVVGHDFLHKREISEYSQIIDRIRAFVD
jgi:ribulose-phosphate 3-epimerase